MQVTTTKKTSEGQLFNLDNGAALLLKNASNGTTFPVYVFANGRTYSRFSETTMRPAMAAVRRFLAA